MIGFYHIKDGMSVCYNKLWKLLIDKNMNKKTRPTLFGLIVFGLSDKT